MMRTAFRRWSTSRHSSSTCCETRRSCARRCSRSASGTGGVSVALLEMGASRVKGVDLSPASVDLARRRAAAAGFAEQATFEVGQGAAVRDERHDWVILDRVLCCDGHPDRMLDAVVGAAQQRVALSVPSLAAGAGC